MVKGMGYRRSSLLCIDNKDFCWGKLLFLLEDFLLKKKLEDAFEDFTEILLISNDLL